MMSACNTFDSPTTAVRVVCLGIGFTDATCAGVQAALPATIVTCDALVDALPEFCELLAASQVLSALDSLGPTPWVALAAAWNQMPYGTVDIF